MKKNQILHLNDWKLHQLARAVSSTSQHIQKNKLKIQEAYEWTEKIINQPYSRITKHSLSASIQVAIIASTELSLGVAAVTAAILAPPYLQGLLEKQDIQRSFGLQTVSILVELNKLKNSKGHHPDMLHYENVLDLSVSAILAILLQVCDIIRVNDSSVSFKNLGSELLYYFSTKLLVDLKSIYIPLVHRMRLYDIQAKLADFWLKHTDTFSYYSITAKIGMTKLQRKQKLNLIAEEIYSAIQAHGINFVLKKRIKSIYSIWHKIHKLNVDVDQIHDLAAIRIILVDMNNKTLQEEKIACWKVLSVVSHLYNPICHIMRDWISIPKDTSYEALHLIFETYRYGRLELQIRTERMDYIAEHGKAAHWKYKNSV